MNCKQIQNLLYYYIYRELNPALQEYISMHLEECPICNEYHANLLKEINSNKNIEIISAYIDNELSDKENIQTKKNIILNNKFRKKYEKLLSLSTILKNTLSRQEFNMKEDFTKRVFKELNMIDEIYGKNIYTKIAGIFTIIFMGLFLITLAIIGI